MHAGYYSSIGMHRCLQSRYLVSVPASIGNMDWKNRTGQCKVLCGHVLLITVQH